MKPINYNNKDSNVFIRDDVDFVFLGDYVPQESFRPVVLTSLGCHCNGASLVHVDQSDPITTLIGQNRRVAFVPPTPDKRELEQIGKFTLMVCNKLLIPLSPSTDTSRQHWKDNTKYPLWRKLELDKIDEIRGHILEKRDTFVKGFSKDETYPEYKNTRGINARSDNFKNHLGPYIKLIEKEVFKLKYFIKYVPVPDRGKVIYDRLYDPLRKYETTDHTSFEGHFTKEIKEHIEFVLYFYMTQHLFGYRDFKSLCDDVLVGRNSVFYKWFMFRIEATRMTGEMDTSLGNGWSNLMLLMYCAFHSGIDIWEQFDCFVEGDDGISAIPKDKFFKFDVLKKLGFTVKLEETENINTASFCGNVFAPGVFHNLTNPIETMLSFGWTTGRYSKSKRSRLMSLLRSKALSLIYEYKGCPILQELGKYGLRMTEGYRARAECMNEYQREQLALQMEYLKKRGLPLNTEISMESRLLVEQLWGITLEMQYIYEDYLRKLDQLVPLSLDLFSNLLHPECVDYFVRYVKEVNRFDDINHPGIIHYCGVRWNEDYIDQVNLRRTTVFDQDSIKEYLSTPLGRKNFRIWQTKFYRRYNF